MKLNIRQNNLTAKTHEGAPAYGNLTPIQELRRSVLSCFLWESEHYEDGKSIADRIMKNALKITPRQLAALAIEARNDFHLRHVPLLLLTILAKTGSGTSVLSETIPQVVKRADELSELIAIYWKAGKRPLSAQMKKGLAKAIHNFDAYQLAKYNRDATVKLRDVMFLTHPKPRDEEQTAIFKKLAENTLDAPDTWEVALSGGKDKKETFERLLRENKLGYMALLRNIRGMYEAKVEHKLIAQGLIDAKGFHNVLPFRFIAAARACPTLEPIIDAALLRKIDQMKTLKGTTVILVDVSGSMDEELSAKSDMTRLDAAAGLAAIIKSEVLHVVSFSNGAFVVPPRRGMAGIDAIVKSQPHGGTNLGSALHDCNTELEYDRIIVITDEQSHDKVGGPKGKGYMINVASNKNGVGYGPWVHLDGFSERVLDFIIEHETLVDDHDVSDLI